MVENQSQILKLWTSTFRSAGLYKLKSSRDVAHAPGCGGAKHARFVRHHPPARIHGGGNPRFRLEHIPLLDIPVQSLFQNSCRVKLECVYFSPSLSSLSFVQTTQTWCSHTPRASQPMCNRFARTGGTMYRYLSGLTALVYNIEYFPLVFICRHFQKAFLFRSSLTFQFSVFSYFNNARVIRGCPSCVRDCLPW